jgi:hypothetical protein
MKCFKCQKDFSPKKETHIIMRTVWLVTTEYPTGFVGHDRYFHRACHSEFGSNNSSQRGNNHFVHCFTQVKRGGRILKGETFPDFLIYRIALSASSESVEPRHQRWGETVGSEAKRVESDKEPEDIAGQEGPLTNSAGPANPMFLHEKDEQP